MFPHNPDIIVTTVMANCALQIGVLFFAKHGGKVVFKSFWEPVNAYEAPGENIMLTSNDA